MKYLIVLFLFPICANANNQAISKVLEACHKDKNINRFIKKTEKTINRVLERYGVKSAAIVTTSITKALIEKRAEIKTGKITWIANDKSVLQINEKQILFKIEWNIP